MSETLDDIEDIVSRDESVTVQLKTRTKDAVSIKARSSGKIQTQRESDLKELNVQSFVPGTNKVRKSQWNMF